MADRTGAERARRHRRRQRAGRIVLSLEVDEVDHVEMLIEAGFLCRSGAEDRDEIAAATARLVERLVAASLRDA